VDNRVVKNALNFILSKRFKFNGEDFLPLAEVVRELQAELDGPEDNTQGGHSQGQDT
jgi:hypothetical protein